MKKIFLITLATIFNITVCLSQEGNSTDGYIGIGTRISSDGQYLGITNFYYGSPANILGLKIGDRIYRIDDKAISELTDPISHIRGVSGTWVKLTISRFGKKALFDVNVPRISIPFNDNNYVSEGFLTALIHTDDLTDYSRMNQSTMSLLSDDSKDMFKYKTYDFELTSVEDPLLEKKLFNELGGQLDNIGMKRSKENPDLVILMNFYSGQKEQYVPPQQIVSTRVKSLYNWYWGIVPMPITESTTKEGYTDVTYLTSISLKFLDADEIAGSKTPPVIWSGSISQASKTKQILLDECGNYFALMLNQFPEVWRQNSEHYYLSHYTYTGLWFNKNDFQNIGEVIPGSPAYKIGIQKGDKILSINGYKLPDKYSDVGPNKWSEMAFRGDRSGFRYLYMFAKLVFKPYKTEDATLIFKIKRNGKKMTFEIKPEDRTIFLLMKK